MGKPTGFIEFKREDAPYRPKEERITDYKDVVKYLSDENIKIQASRCMDCGIPFCHSLGCSLYNLIPEWNDLVYKGNWKEAYERLNMTNNFPEITGRICPALCEASCTLSINDAPVTIKQIELAIIEHAFQQGWVKPCIPKNETGKKVAVIGSGPAGLAAAQELRRKGHSVTLFEKDKLIGGILRYGIPDFKLEKWVLDRRIDQLKAEGVVFETGIDIGDDISAKYLKKTFDVILLTIGAKEPRDLKVPGRDLEGIHFAMEYLTMSNKSVSGEINSNEIISAKGKNVLVIGGGDTGSDCVGTANRQGALKVSQFEIMPKPIEAKDSSNPNWPEWPIILRTSSSHKEGCERDWDVLTKSFSGEKCVNKVNCVKVKWDYSSKFPSFSEIKDSEFTINADLVFLAMGFVHPEHKKLLQDLSVKLDNRGNIETVNNNYSTTVNGIFAAGDADIGASLVLKAIYHGREAAKSIHAFLQEKNK